MNPRIAKAVGASQHKAGHGPLAALLLLMPIALAAGCAPELGNDPPPDYFEFDPSGAAPRVPLPNVIVVNQETGLVDYGLPSDPTFCDTIAGMPGATCEFLQFLQTMDGFPNGAMVTIPVSASLDLETLTHENLVVFALGPKRNLDLTFDTVTRQLVVHPLTPWELGSTYVVAIRGYDDGVRTATGNRVVAPVIYSLLKREESLISCTPDPPDPEELINPLVDRHCKFFHLLAEGIDPDDASSLAAVEAQIVDLERLRQGFLQAGLWEATEFLAGMPKDEVAMVFAFPIHSGPVVELDPEAGKMPEVVDATNIRLMVTGNLDPSTVVAGLRPGNPGPTVALLNLTKLAENDIVGGLPTFDATVIGSTLQLTTATSLIPGDSYAIVLATVTPFSEERNAITNMAGVPLVPPPAVAMLRGLQPLYDEVTGQSNIPATLTAEQAQALEESRLLLKALLDNPLFPLDRDQIGYLFAFDMPSP